MEHTTAPEEEGHDKTIDPVGKKGWASRLQKRRWRLLLVVAGTVVLSILHGVLISSALGEPIEFLKELLVYLLWMCTVYLPYTILPMALALWWVVDLRRKFIPVALYFAVLILMTSILTVLKYGEDIRQEEREHYEAILDEQMEEQMSRDDIPESSGAKPE
jgi:hypothetical protein